MPLPFNIGLKACWLAVLFYWVWSARHIKSPQRTETTLKQVLVYWLPIAVAVALLGPGRWFGHGWLREPFVPHTTPVYSVGLLLCVLGTGIAIWARHILGRNWSGTVQLKHDHELIRTGPYAHVRHPIYSGLLLVFAGNAVLVGDWRGVLAVALVFVSFWLKLRTEERWLGELFGPAYADYRRHTKALVPALL